MNSLVFSNMLHRPARTVVSVLGIAIGVLLVVFTVGLANGSLRDKAMRESSVGAEIMLCTRGTFCLSSSGNLVLPISLAAEIENVEGVRQAVPIGHNTVPASDNLLSTRLIDGISFDQYAQISGIDIMEGRRFTDGADEALTDTAWLPEKKLKIGDTIKIYERDFRIVGTYEPSVGARVKIPLATMQTEAGASGMATAFLVKVRKDKKPETIAENLQAKFPDHQVIMTKDLEGLYMSSIPALGVFLNVIIGVAALISLLVILLTMYTTVTERTRQIGILKSLGMSKTKIAWTIIQEALLLSAGGVLTGIILTLVASFVLEKRTTLHVQIEPQTILLIVVVALLSSIVGALFPALRAARLDAVEALSYE